MFSSLFATKSDTRRGTKRRQKSKRCNQLDRQRGLRVETLEDRMMLAVVTPTEIGKLFAEDADRGDRFGWSVAMTDDGKVAVIGAHKDDGAGRDAGAAYLFYNAGGDVWGQVAKLTGPSESVGRKDEFGGSVAIVGGSNDFTVVVGTGGTGDLFVYDGLFIDFTGAVVGISGPPITLTAGTNSLDSVSIGRDQTTSLETIVAGDRRDSGNGTSSGAAYVFTAFDGDWSTIAAPEKLLAKTPAANESFGRSVAISADGNTIAVGAPGSGGTNASGEVYLFDRGTNGVFDEGVGDPPAVIAPDVPNSLGFRLDISGDGGVLVASSLFTTWVATRGNGIWPEMTLLTQNENQLLPFGADGSTNEDVNYFGWSVSVNDDGDTILVGTNASPEQTAYSFSTSSATKPIQGFGQQARFASSTTTDGSLSNVATNGTQVLIGNQFDDAAGELFSADSVGAVHVFSLTPTIPVSGITVTPTAGLVTSEDAGTDSFTIVLDTDPGEGITVTVPLTSSDITEGIVSPSSVVFTGGIAGDWGSPQTVTVTGVDDDGDEDGDQAYFIQTGPATASGTSSPYDALDPADVSVTNLDNDAPPPPPQLEIYVYDIRFESRRGNKWRAVFEIRIDSNANGKDATDDAANGATINTNFAGTPYPGTTDSNGVFKTPWIRKLSSGDHYANALDLVLAGFVWDKLPGSLSLTAEDDTDLDGNPDDVLTI